MKLFIVIFSIVLISGCQSLPVKNLDLNKIANLGSQAVKQFKGVSEQEEIAIGRESTAVLLGAIQGQPIFDNQAAQRYVNLVGSNIARHSERSALQWHFVISNDNDINAFAAPGGYIIVTRGLFMSLQNEAQLAAELAHEIAHVEEKHHLNSLQKNGWLALASDATVTYLDATGNEKLDPQMTEQVLNATRNLYAKGLDKSDEYAADARALTLLEKAGYDPFAMVDVLVALQASHAQDTRLALLFKTHPKPEDRLNALAEHVDNFDATGVTLAERYRQYVK